MEMFAAVCNGIETAIISCGDNENGIGHILGLVIEIISVGVGVLGLIGISIAGMQYLTAKGSEEQVRKAKRRLFEIVIGLASYVLIVALLQWLLPGGILNPSEMETFDVPETSSDSSGSGGGTSTPTKRFAAETSLKDGNNDMDYWLNVPNNATDGMPLVIFLHGSEERGHSDVVKAQPPVQYIMNSSRPYIAIAPVLKRQNSTWTSTLSSLKSVIDDVASKYQVDMNRIYIVGFSLGAIGTWDMVSKYPDYFAAAVPISCCSSSANAAHFQHTKIYATSGGAESYYSSCMKDFVNTINNNGGSARYDNSDYAGLGHSDMQGNLKYDDIFNWLLSQ